MVARLLSLLFLIGTVHAQSLYCGQDTNLSAKVTLSNLVQRSSELDNAFWTKWNSTITANTVISPDGSLNADTYAESATTTQHGLFNASSFTGLSLADHRHSAYVKSGTITWVRLAPSSATTASAYFNIKTCTTGTIEAGITARALAVGNGWCYIEAVRAHTISTGYWQLYSVTADNTPSSHLGAVTNTLFIYGARLNLASDPIDYLATTSASATLAGVCASGTTQSPTDPSRCIRFTPEEFRPW